MIYAIERNGRLCRQICLLAGALMAFALSHAETAPAPEGTMDFPSRSVLDAQLETPAGQQSSESYVLPERNLAFLEELTATQEPERWDLRLWGAKLNEEGYLPVDDTMPSFFRSQAMPAYTNEESLALGLNFVFRFGA